VLPSFRHDGIEIAFCAAGDGEPIVLVHRAAANKEDWIGAN